MRNYLLCFLLFLVSPWARAGQHLPDGSILGESSQVQVAARETTDQIMARAYEDNGEEHEGEEFEIFNQFPDRSHLVLDPRSPKVSQWPPAPTNHLLDTIRSGQNNSRGHGSPFTPQIIGTQWDGILSTQVSLVPPDTQMAVGPTQVLVIINGYVKVYDKNGVAGALDTPTNTFFNSVRGGNLVGDNRVRYDRTAQRWILVTETFTSPNRIIIAVSDSPTITGSTVWTFYFFVQDTIGAPGADAGALADYITLSVDEDGLILGANMFNPGFIGCTIWVVRKNTLYTGGPLTITAFRQITTSSGAGIYTPHGVSTEEAGITTSYVMGVDNITAGRLVIRRLTNVDSSAPVLGLNVTIVVPSTINPTDVTVLGSGSQIDSVDDRIIECEIRRNRVNNTWSLWACHHIEVDATGVANAAGNRNGIRWYQLNNLAGTPNLVQSGTLWDPAASNPVSYWQSSINMSGQGHMAIVPTAAGPARRLEVVAAGRLRSDALGVTQAPSNVVTTLSNYNATTRWGDYAAVRVDPQDEQTLWGCAEYCNGNNTFAVRVVKLIAPPPAAPASTSPSSLAQGATANVVVTCTSTGGSELYDTEAGLNRLAAAFSGTGITVNSVTWNSITQATLNVTVGGAAATGLRNITMTNPDGQSATGVGIFTVTAGANPVPTLTLVSPSSATAGGAGFTITCTGTNFVAGSIVRWNSSDRVTTFGSSTSITAAITAADIATAGTATVTVFNPTPGGGTSSGLTFTINNPAPTLTLISPNNAIAGGAGFTITCTGTDFNSQSKVRWNGSDRVTTFVNSTSITAAITAADIATAGTATVIVFNPTPGGGTSAGLTFTKNNPVPTTSAISPNPVAAGGSAFTLTVTGTNFNAQSIVRFNGSNRTTTFVNATTLQAAINASDIVSPGIASITVFAPSPGGGTSNAQTLTISGARAFNGTVNLLGWSVSPSGIVITLRFRPVGGAPGSEFLTQNVTLNASSQFSLSTSLAAGNYDIYADGSIWLQRRLANVNATGNPVNGLVWNLPTGDIDGDGDVTNGDYAIWAANNGNSVTPGTNGDLDGDGDVTNADYALWASSNGLSDDN